MYIPKYFQLEDQPKIINFIEKHPFGTIITKDVQTPVATHLPFILNKEEQSEGLTLYSHFAKANQHWQKVSNQRSLVIFNGPHAYISPKYYDNKNSVPTWNYVSVHVYGNIKLIEDYTECISVIEQTINIFDKEYLKQWYNLPNEYKQGMMNGIKLFRMKSTEIQAKEKLSQNKTIGEQTRIATDLYKSKNSFEKEIGELMSKKHFSN